MKPISERRVTSVRLGSMSHAKEEPGGSSAIKFMCEIQFEGFDGRESGPSITIGLARALSDGSTFQDIERDALEGVSEILNRAGQVHFEELHSAYTERLERDAKAIQDIEALRAP